MGAYDEDRMLQDIRALRSTTSEVASELRVEAAGIGNPKARKPHEVALATRLFALADKLDSL